MRPGDVSRRLSKLVVTSKGELEGNAGSLDRHDRNRSDGRATTEEEGDMFVTPASSHL